MEVIRRNTDYGLRMMVAIAKRFKNEEVMSARQLTSDCNFSYELGRKLLQRLYKAGFVNSAMGLKGGFTLSRKPSEITLMEIINILQGDIYLNECLDDGKGCEFEPECGVNSALAFVQQQLHDYLHSITLERVIELEKIKIKKRA